MSRQHEVSFNNNLAQLLDGMFPSTKFAQKTQMSSLKVSTNTPTSPIIGKGLSPVVIEAEFGPRSKSKRKPEAD